jgi:hypothetical protein
VHASSFVYYFINFPEAVQELFLKKSKDKGRVQTPRKCRQNKRCYRQKRNSSPLLEVDQEQHQNKDGCYIRGSKKYQIPKEIQVADKAFSRAQGQKEWFRHRIETGTFIFPINSFILQ